MSDTPSTPVTPTTRKPLYAVGDVVRHKATHQQAVVTGHNTTCVNPEHMVSTGFRLPHCAFNNLPDCIQGFTGTYHLSAGYYTRVTFEDNNVSAREIELEPVDVVNECLDTVAKIRAYECEGYITAAQAKMLSKILDRYLEDKVKTPA